jgi:thiamine biosynthesis lipoprotein
MNTRFEAILHGPRAMALQAAGEEAMEEIRRMESLLSYFRPESEIAAVNRGAAKAPVPVSPVVFQVLEQALRMAEATEGAFDPTVAPLLKAWGLMGGGGSVPGEADLAEARRQVGYPQVMLDRERRTVAFQRPGMQVDLGSIGKGFALDRAAACLRENGIEHALLHGGTSTVIGLGHPPDAESWRIAIPAPSTEAPLPRVAESTELPLATVELRDSSLSVSAVWGKGFERDGRYYGHVMDPRTGEPVAGAAMAAVVLGSATDSDALSTALLVRGAAWLETLRQAGSAVACLVVERSVGETGYRVAAHGISFRAV